MHATFLDYVSPVQPIDVSHVVVAAMLDEARVSPQHLLEASVAYIQVDDKLIKYALNEFIRFVVESDDPKKRNAPAHYVTWEAPDPGRIASAFSKGSRHVTISTDALDEQSAYLVDVALTLKSLAPVTIQKIVLRVTGAVIPPAKLPASVSYSDLVVSLRSGMTAAQFLARLARVQSAAKNDDAKNDDAKTDATKTLPEFMLPKEDDDYDDAKVVEIAPPKKKKELLPLSKMYGYGRAKDWGLQLAADIHDYQANKLSWDDVDKDICLYGPPGTGKTTFARSLALEAGIPFFPTSFAEMISAERSSGGGNVERALKKIMEEAKKVSPSIVFIDELDAIPARNGTRDHNSTYFDAVLTAFLNFLDDSAREGVVVIAATNHVAKIDAALLRPGRLDTQVAIELPDVADIVHILHHHIADPAIRIDDLKTAARACRGMSGADIEKVCRDARRAARKRSRPVTPSDIVTVVTSQKPTISPKIDRAVCAHEAGHALVGIFNNLLIPYVDADRHRTKMEIPTGQSNREEIEGYISALLAGRAAEQVVCNRVGAGVYGDLEQATQMARAVVNQFGMAGSLTSVDDTTASLDRERAAAVETILQNCYAKALAILTTHADKLKALAEKLRAERYLDRDEILEIVGTDIAMTYATRQPDEDVECGFGM